ncbi:MAG: hypothetical protein AAFP22_12555 [Planctomycetota bacterium]
MLHRLLALASVLLFMGFAFAPSASAQDAVTHGTYDSSASSGSTGNGTVVSDGSGTVSFTDGNGDGAVWIQDEDGTYKKENPKEGEEGLRLTFTEKPPTPEEQETGKRRYSWTLKNGANKVGSGSLAPR